jgi:hypothetical protein
MFVIIIDEDGGRPEGVLFIRLEPGATNSAYSRCTILARMFRIKHRDLDGGDVFDPHGVGQTLYLPGRDAGVIGRAIIPPFGVKEFPLEGGYESEHQSRRFPPPQSFREERTWLKEIYGTRSTAAGSSRSRRSPMPP